MRQADGTEDREEESGAGAVDVDGSAPPSDSIPAPQDPASVTTHTPSSPARRASDRARCDDGDLAGCHAAALDAFNRPPSPDNDADALRYFSRGCDGGYAPSCNGVGVLHAQGRGVPRDEARAFGFYRQACEARASTACQHVAAALRAGQGVAADPAGAERADARRRCISQASGREALLDACPSL